MEDTERLGGNNTESFDPSTLPNPEATGASDTCASANSNDDTLCGFNGLFSYYGSVAPFEGTEQDTAISNDQNNVFSDNTYSGPIGFDEYDQSNAATWAQSTAGLAYSGGGTFNAQDTGQFLCRLSAPERLGSSRDAAPGNSGIRSSSSRLTGQGGRRPKPFKSARRRWRIGGGFGLRGVKSGASLAPNRPWGQQRQLEKSGLSVLLELLIVPEWALGQEPPRPSLRPGPDGRRVRVHARRCGAGQHGHGDAHRGEGERADSQTGGTLDV